MAPNALQTINERFCFYNQHVFQGKSKDAIHPTAPATGQVTGLMAVSPFYRPSHLPVVPDEPISPLGKTAVDALRPPALGVGSATPTKDVHNTTAQSKAQKSRGAGTLGTDWELSEDLQNISYLERGIATLDPNQRIPLFTTDYKRNFIAAWNVRRRGRRDYSKPITKDEVPYSTVTDFRPPGTIYQVDFKDFPNRPEPLRRLGTPPFPPRSNVLKLRQQREKEFSSMHMMNSTADNESVGSAATGSSIAAALPRRPASAAARYAAPVWNEAAGGGRRDVGNDCDASSTGSNETAGTISSNQSGYPYARQAPPARRIRSGVRRGPEHQYQSTRDLLVYEESQTPRDPPPKGSAKDSKLDASRQPSAAPVHFVAGSPAVALRHAVPLSVKTGGARLRSEDSHVAKFPIKTVINAPTPGVDALGYPRPDGSISTSVQRGGHTQTQHTKSTPHTVSLNQSLNVTAVGSAMNLASRGK